MAIVSPSYQLSDEKWRRIDDLLPPNRQRGGQWKDHRLMVDAASWIWTNRARSFVSEPDRRQRNVARKQAEKKVAYTYRRGIGCAGGKRLLRRRAGVYFEHGGNQRENPRDFGFSSKRVTRSRTSRHVKDQRDSVFACK